jgi:hypothetical protein
MPQPPSCNFIRNQMTAKPEANQSRPAIMRYSEESLGATSANLHSDRVPQVPFFGTWVLGCSVLFSN